MYLQPVCWALTNNQKTSLIKHTEPLNTRQNRKSSEHTEFPHRQTLLVALLQLVYGSRRCPPGGGVNAQHSICQNKQAPCGGQQLPAQTCRKHLWKWKNSKTSLANIHTRFHDDPPQYLHLSPPVLPAPPPHPPSPWVLIRSVFPGGLH